MSSNESFDELEKKLSGRIEEALNEIREEFLGRIQSATGRLEEMVGSELTAARQEAASVATAEADEARAALLAEAEEAKAAAIAEAVEAKEAELQELLQSKDAAIAELEQARDVAMAEANEAREAAFAQAEDSKSAAIAEALQVKETEFQELLGAKEAEHGERLSARESELNEQLAAKDSTIAELEDSRERALAEVRDEMDSALSAARSAAEETLSGAIAAAVLALHERVTDIDEGRTQSDILSALLGGSAHHASRSLLFLTREDGLQGWGGQGFDIDEGRLEQIHIEYEDGTAWAELAEGRGTVELSDEACSVLLRDVDGSHPREGVLIPLVLRDRLAAALYADSLHEEEPFHVPVLQLLTYITGQALETLPMRQRSATATLRLVTDAPADDPGLELWHYLVPEEPSVEAEPIPESIAAPEMAPDEPIEEATEPEPGVALEEPTPEEPEQYVPAEETGFTVEDEMASSEAEPVAPPPVATEAPAESVEEAPIEAPPAADVAPPTEVAPPTQVAPPAGAEVAPPEDVDGPGWAFTTRRFGESADEDAGHEEARRLARLLVTEIKLYNEEQVEEGRRGRNIYRALREDIDRSRQIYEERIDEGVRSETNYFRDELVRILAGGDEEAMGM